jgi:hypothetical protein
VKPVAFGRARTVLSLRTVMAGVASASPPFAERWVSPV